MNIKAFRKANNLTQEALGDYLGTKKSFISQVENGHCSLPDDKLSKLLNNTNNWDTTMLSNSISEAISNTAIPLLPIDAAAGLLSGDDTQVMAYDCDYYTVPMFRGADFLIPISGDSMLPKYCSGDIVACRRLTIDTFFQWGRVYVIGSEQGVIIKRVLPGTAANHIMLVSDNTKYPPFELDLNRVRSIALVIGVVRSE